MRPSAVYIFHEQYARWVLATEVTTRTHFNYKLGCFTKNMQNVEGFVMDIISIYCGLVVKSTSMANTQLVRAVGPTMHPRPFSARDPRGRFSATSEILLRPCRKRTPANIEGCQWCNVFLSEFASWQNRLMDHVLLAHVVTGLSRADSLDS